MIPFIEKALRLANDGGPIYKETDLTRFPVEPFNTLSNLVFLGIILFFAARVYKEAGKQYFLAICIPILSLGFLGGTMYHATRSSAWWLYLDWVPIVLLCMAASFYFVFRLKKPLHYQVGMIILIAIISIGVRRLPVPPSFKETLGYIATAAALLLPMLWYVISAKGRYAGFIAAALGSFLIAIFFRMLDRFVDGDLLFMGTHWLWHLFGGISVFFLMYYIYLDAKSGEKLSVER